MSLLATCGIVWLVVIGHVTGSDWFEEPYGDESFNAKAEFNTNVTLVCNETRVPEEAVFQYWIAPNLDIWNKSFYDDFRTLDGMAGWSVSDDGLALVAFLVQEVHFGFYYCIKENLGTGEIYVIKKAINYRGPYWGDLWKKYETATIIGLSSAGGFLLIAIFIAVTWHFQYVGKDKNEESFSTSSTPDASTSQKQPTGEVKVGYNEDPEVGKDKNEESFSRSSTPGASTSQKQPTGVDNVSTPDASTSQKQPTGVVNYGYNKDFDVGKDKNEESFSRSSTPDASTSQKQPTGVVNYGFSED